MSESYDEVESAPIGGLESHLLLTEPLMLVLPRDRPTRKQMALATLSDSSWIAGLDGTQFSGALEQACRSAGFTPRIVHRADDGLLFQTLVAAGLGVGLLPALACMGPTDVQFATTTPAPPRRHVSALVRLGAARRPALRAVLDALRRQADLHRQALRSKAGRTVARKR